MGCTFGVITGTPTFDCAPLGEVACRAETCCRWVRDNGGWECEPIPCASFDHPDICPGCNWCKDTGDPGYLGWGIGPGDDRGVLPWDIYVDGGLSCHGNSGYSVPNGVTVYCANHFWTDHGAFRRIYPGGAVRLYGRGNVPAPP